VRRAGRHIAGPLCPILAAVAVASAGGAGNGRQAWLAFSSDRDGHPDVFVVGYPGGTPRPVTHGPSSETAPVWSPDGRSLLFVSDRTGNYDLWRVRADGSGLARLTRSGDDDSAPDWAPDGRRIA